MFFLSANLDGDWQWRVPFLVSAVLVVAGLIVRAKLSESPEFEEAKASGATEKNPPITVLRRDWQGILRVIALRIVESFAYYSTATYLISHIPTSAPSRSAPSRPRAC